MTTLYVQEGQALRPADAAEILHQAQTLLAIRLRPGSAVLDHPEVVRTFLRLHFAPLEHEVFAVIFLDGAGRLIELVELFRGTLTRTVTPAREIAKEALTRNAAAVILIHNHPDGDSAPSFEDQRTTQELKRALALVEVEVLDHLIIGESIFSFCEAGVL